MVVEVQGVEGSLPPLQMLERGEVKEIGGRVWSRGSRVPHSMCDDILSEFATGVSNAGELKDVGVEVVVSAAESESRGERGKDDACGLVVWAVTSTGCILGILFPCLPTACLHASIRAYLHCILETGKRLKKGPETCLKCSKHISGPFSRPLPRIPGQNKETAP